VTLAHAVDADDGNPDAVIGTGPRAVGTDQGRTCGDTALFQEMATVHNDGDFGDDVSGWGDTLPAGDFFR
jgi:hypothetical protein